MGRNSESVRMAMKKILARWMKASKALKKEYQICGQIIAKMAMKRPKRGILCSGRFITLGAQRVTNTPIFRSGME